MLSRLALTLTTAAVLTVAAAPVARADIGFLVMPGFAGAEIDGDGDATKLELVRAGAVIASSDDGAVTVDGLEAGDVARSYNADGTPAGNATYDGTPVISGACVGGTAFTATRATTAEVEYAGAFTGSALEPLTASWDTARPAHVTLSGPLGDEDMVFVSVARHDVDPPVTSMRIEPAVTCSANPNPGATPNPPPHGQKPTPGQPNGAKLSLTTARSTLAKAKLRKRITVPVTLPERGRIDLRLILRGKTIGRGARTASGATKVTLKLTKRPRRGTKVTLRATFTPSRAGAEPQRASVKVTLTGSSSRA